MARAAAAIKFPAIIVLSGIALVGIALPPASHADGAPAAKTPDERIDELSREVQDLKALVLRLQHQLSKTIATAPTTAAAPAAADAPPGPAPAAAPSSAPAAVGSKAPVDILHGVTVNAMLDGYFEYNTNSPVGRVNLLRAYDVSSNSFSLNQADLIIESAPDPAADRRYGMRVDFQFGQATATLQGSPANELRPAVYRNLFQAYGTYVFPVARGLTVDFGKWASSLGLEGNYTKDQYNYSRSYWFDYLPFYHMGVRAKLAVNDTLAFNAWITNGTNQTEAFNNYKDQMLGFVWTATPAVTWTFNVYQGQEHPDVVYIQNATGAQQNLPNQQGTYIAPVANPPDGRLQIIDTYMAYQATRALVLAAEADYVQERLYSHSPAQHVDGGALYAAYQLTPTVAIAARAEYLADIGGLYSGVTQHLTEQTLSFDYRPADGFLFRGEYRRDHSNQPYFLSHALNSLEMTQPTIGFGLIWWFGQKQGTW